MLTTYDRETMPEKVMESYQSWLGDGPELAILRMSRLFDRLADERALAALLAFQLLAMPAVIKRHRLSRQEVMKTACSSKTLNV